MNVGLRTSRAKVKGIETPFGRRLFPPFFGKGSQLKMGMSNEE